MTLVEKFLGMDEEELKKVLRDMPFWIKFLLKVYYRKVQEIKDDLNLPSL